MIDRVLSKQFEILGEPTVPQQVVSLLTQGLRSAEVWSRTGDEGHLDVVRIVLESVGKLLYPEDEQLGHLVPVANQHDGVGEPLPVEVGFGVVGMPIIYRTFH